MDIKPRNIITTDGIKEVNTLKIVSLYDNLEDKVIFRATLLSDNVEIISLDTILEGDEYIKWDSSIEDAYIKVMDKLGL